MVINVTKICFHLQQLYKQHTVKFSSTKWITADYIEMIVIMDGNTNISALAAGYAS